MKFYYLICLFFVSCLVTAQRTVKALVGLDSDIEGIYLNSGLGYEGMDEWLPYDGANLLESGYDGYSYYLLNNFRGVKIPVHTENGDDFDLVFDKNMELKDAYYKGDVGAIKNNYLLDRYNFVKQQELKPGFLKDNKEQLLNRITFVQDSMLVLAKGLSLSERFIKDENMYWEFYKMYLSTFYEVLKAPRQSDFYALPIGIESYPNLDYNTDMFLQFNDYASLMVQRYIRKLDDAENYDLKEAVLDELSKRSMLKFQVLSWIRKQVFLNNDMSEVYAKLHRKNSFFGKDIELAALNRKQKRFKKSPKFPKLNVYDRFQKPVDLSGLGNESTALFLFDTGDTNGAMNITLWNKFYIENKNNYKHFIFIFLNADLNRELFENLSASNEIAGFMIGANHLGALKLFDKMGHVTLPALLTLENGLITDFNASRSLLLYNFKESNLNENLFFPQLGSY
ncbi:MAG: hypothetical protein NWQ09_10520 [Nonlabens sp.]|nr:hypothetical protein [Nonlabens sp.]